MTSENPTTDAELPGMSAETISHLVRSHARFLAFLERRVETREAAEDILQEAFARALARGHALREGEAAHAWFYRLLRNAIIDHYRRRAVERRALDAVSEPAPDEPDEALLGTVCECLHELLATLKPEYAEAVRSVDLGQDSVADYAQRVGITPNNAGVRLHRAREALHRRLVASCGTCATHGCLDCNCRSVRGTCAAIVAPR